MAGVRLRLALVLAPFLGFESGACQRPIEELPEPKTPGFQYACYPVQYLRPPKLPSTAPCGHQLAHPNRERTYTIVMRVSKEGTVQSARVVEEPSEAVTACLAATLGHWHLEPARTCSGEPLESEYRIPYISAFGIAACMSLGEPVPGAVPVGVLQAGLGGRTNGCS
jgi:hypothetical protein